jgi:hypothetical protein
MGTAPRNEDFRRLNATKTLPGSLTRTVAIINPDNPTPGTKDTFLPRAGARHLGAAPAAISLNPIALIPIFNTMR